MTPDLDRRAVYACEDAVLAMLDALGDQERQVTFDGEVFVPEPEARFGDAEAVQSYVDRVLEHVQGHDFGGREEQPVSVRSRRGAARATYESGPGAAVIAVPAREIGGSWALREHVVLHEVAHHLAGVEVGHGPEFRAAQLRLLEAVGHPVTAHLLSRQYAVAGLSGGAAAPEPVLVKIAKLLRMAEGTTNAHERDAFTARAQQLATRNSVALALARAHEARTSGVRRQRPEHRSIVIGEPGQRGLSRYVRLMLAIGTVNDVRFTISHDSTRVTGFGFGADLDVVEALWPALVVQMVDEANRWLATGVHKAEQLQRWDRRRQRWVSKPVPTITARLSFYESFADRIGERLGEVRRSVVAASEADDLAAPSPHAPVSTALALREKTKEVEAFFDGELRRLGIRRTWRGGASAADNHSHSADQAGVRAADRADLTGEGAKKLGGAHG